MSKLSYEFDLNYDCKTVGEVAQLAKALVKEIQSIEEKKKYLKGLINLCRAHGLNSVAKKFADWG